ncbi:O-antigen ligase family protein [Luethyella okanaganae]|uniref:O-antigen ligase family protein n=1 Tax=Luethyella okanaganae TaxID=69372 RepID=A0ABW1VB90_9MICO
MKPGRSRFAVRTLAVFVLFTAFAGQFWRNLLGWWGFGAVAAIAVIAAVAALILLKPEWRWRRMPKSLLLFLVFAALSILWSFYPGATAVGIAIQWATTAAALFLALCLDWMELLRTLGTALRWILALSLVFEFAVAIFVRGPLLPFWTDYGDERVPKAFYWSRGLLFDGGPIEGIVANRNLLCFIALLAVVVFAVQLAERAVKRGRGVVWLALAVAVFVLARSATVILAAAGVAVVLGFALWTRMAGPDRRRPVYLTSGFVLIAGVAGTITLWKPLLTAFGKNEDLTGRLDIWAAVAGLAAGRPVAGWGWVSYWAPWVEPFDDLAARNGVVYLQAHNAWLDVWLQLGVIGVVLFASLVLATLWRSWFLAVDRPRFGLDADRPYTASSLLPLLVMAALLVQSVAESRILIEGGWVLLVVLAVTTKRRHGLVEAMP